jgi:hypothetical protein
MVLPTNSTLNTLAFEPNLADALKDKEDPSSNSDKTDNEPKLVCPHIDIVDPPLTTPLIDIEDEMNILFSTDKLLPRRADPERRDNAEPHST